MNHSIWLCGIFSTHTHINRFQGTSCTFSTFGTFKLHSFNLTQGCEFWASPAAYLPGDPQGGLENDHLRPGAKQLWSDCFKITSEVTIVMVIVIIAIEIVIISSAGLTRWAPAAARLNLFYFRLRSLEPKQRIKTASLRPNWFWIRGLSTLFGLWGLHPRVKKNMDFTALHLYTLLPVHTLIWSHVIITIIDIQQ
jgi:hypothetical protein